jgi:hypothetical protein
MKFGISIPRHGHPALAMASTAIPTITITDYDYEMDIPDEDFFELYDTGQSEVEQTGRSPVKESVKSGCRDPRKRSNGRKSWTLEKRPD